MAKHVANPSPDHAAANETSAAFCDQLFANLQQRIDALQRSKVQRWCCLFPEGQKRFAYVTHRKRMSRLEIWFSGNPDLQANYPQLEIRSRAPTVGGWKGFDSRFYIDDLAQIPPATDLLVATSLDRDSQSPEIVNLFPNEVPDDAPLWEGTVRKVSVNSYERNDQARGLCIDHYGANCSICGFNFADTYGPAVEGFIHVHHLQLLSQIDGEYVVDPIKDLRPVCPNCHAVLHAKKTPYTIEEVKAFLDDPHHA